MTVDEIRRLQQGVPQVNMQPARRAYLQLVQRLREAGMAMSDRRAVRLQRLMAAMALCGDPDLLVLDEPTTALDVTTQIEVLQAFKKVIKDEGAAAIYVTHDLAVVA